VDSLDLNPHFCKLSQAELITPDGKCLLPVGHDDPYMADSIEHDLAPLCLCSSSCGVLAAPRATTHWHFTQIAVWIAAWPGAAADIEQDTAIDP
jgi:hypothetical protein